MQPLDQAINLSVKMRYKKKLTERYLVSVENNKDANTLLKQCCGSYQHGGPVMERNDFNYYPKLFLQSRFHTPFNWLWASTSGSTSSPKPAIWNKVQKWMDINLEEFVADEPEAPTTPANDG